MYACTEQDETIATNAKEVPLEISLKGCDTRTVITGNTLPDNSQLGIFAVNNDDKISYNNVLSTYTDKQWTTAKTIYLTESGKRIYAYYPYSEKASLDNLSINTREQIDYLYGYAVGENNQMTTVNATSPKANILLKHAMARITLNIKKPKKDADSKGDIYGIILAGVPLSGNLDLRNGKMTTADNGDLTISTKFQLSTEGTNVDILVPPIEGAVQETMLSLNINDKYYSVWMPARKWESGKQYTYAVEVADGALKISEATITPWNNNQQDGIEVGDDNYVE